MAHKPLRKANPAKHVPCARQLSAGVVEPHNSMCEANGVLQSIPNRHCIGTADFEQAYRYHCASNLSTTLQIFDTMPHHQPDPTDMIYFAEVVERGGFAAAGRFLDIPRSRLSRRISGLEDQMGVRLLQRTTRSLSLTSAGDDFLRHCIAVRDAVRDASAAVADVQTAPKGLVRVSCPVTLAQSALGDLMPDFLLRYPDVQLELQVSNRAVNVVDEGFDVALRIRQSIDDSASCVVKKLDVSRIYMVASPSLLRRHGEPCSMAELAALPSLAMDASSNGKASLNLHSPSGDKETLHYSPRYIANDLMTLRFAALAGSGWCWLPDYMCTNDLDNGRLTRLLPDWQTPQAVVHAVFPTRRGMSPAVRSFLDYLGEYLPGHSASVNLVEVETKTSIKAAKAAKVVKAAKAETTAAKAPAAAADKTGTRGSKKTPH